MSTGGSSSSAPPPQQTVTQVQQLPAFEQQMAQNNQNIATSIGSTPYPVYNAPLTQPFSNLQNQGINQVQGVAGSYQPGLNAAAGLTGASTQQQVNPLGAFSAAGVQPGQDPSSMISQFMNPYVMQALQPQLQQLQIQQQMNANKIGSQATQEGAFGDARQGAAEALNNYYGGLQQQGIIGQGYYNAYNQAQQMALAQQQLEQQAFGQAQSGGQAEQQQLLNAGTQFGNIGAQQQNLGLQGASALYGAGQQQQSQGQQELNTAYQQFLNQVNWPLQMLNVQESSLSNSPYNLTNYQTLPPANTTAQNLGAFASVAGGLGSLLGGGQAQASTNTAPFGGTAF
jgi:hypothetical protein